MASLTGCNIVFVSLCKTVSNKCEWNEFCVEMSVIPLFTKICSSRLELTAGLSGLCGFFKRIKSIIFVQLQLHLTRWGRARSFNLTDQAVLVQSCNQFKKKYWKQWIIFTICDHNDHVEGEDFN